MYSLKSGFVVVVVLVTSTLLHSKTFYLLYKIVCIKMPSKDVDFVGRRSFSIFFTFAQATRTHMLICYRYSALPSIQNTATHSVTEPPKTGKLNLRKTQRNQRWRSDSGYKVPLVRSLVQSKYLSHNSK